MKIIITKTIAKIVQKEFVISDSKLIYVGIGSGFILISLVLISALIIYKKKHEIKAKLKLNINDLPTMDFKGRAKKIYSYCQTIFGIRFKTWKIKDESKVIREDIIQNLMLLANGVLAIIFASEWNSDNNPLLIINNKFKSGINISMDIFTTG